MASLESIKTKILNDATEEANSITSEAKKKADEIINKAKLEAESKREQILNKAKTDGALLSERLISSGKLKARNELLSAKGEVLDLVFNKSVESLKNTDEDSMISFIKKNIDGKDLTDSVITVPDKMFEIVKETFKGINIESDASIDGFKITKNGISENYSFEKLVNFRRDELSTEVANLLF